MLERLEEIPDFLASDEPVEILNPGNFINEEDPAHLRSRYFKTSPNPVESIFLVKMPLHKNRETAEDQRYISLVVTQVDQDYKTSITVGVLTSDGLKFSKNCLFNCGPDGCNLESLNDEEKAIIASALETSVL